MKKRREDRFPRWKQDPGEKCSLFVIRAAPVWEKCFSKPDKPPAIRERHPFAGYTSACNFRRRDAAQGKIEE